jgi:hypothetical protein
MTPVVVELTRTIKNYIEINIIIIVIIITGIIIISVIIICLVTLCLFCSYFISVLTL